MLFKKSGVPQGGTLGPTCLNSLIPSEKKYF